VLHHSEAQKLQIYQLSLWQLIKSCHFDEFCFDRSMQMTPWRWQIFGSREISAFSTSCLLVALNLWEHYLKLPLYPLLDYWNHWTWDFLSQTRTICILMYFKSFMYHCLAHSNSSHVPHVLCKFFSSGNGSHDSQHVDLHTYHFIYIYGCITITFTHTHVWHKININAYTYIQYTFVHTHVHIYMLSCLWHVSIHMACDNLW